MKLSFCIISLVSMLRKGLVTKFCNWSYSVEYEFKSVKFKGVVDRLIMNNLDLSGNITEFKTLIQNITDAPTFTSIYIDLYIRDGICQNLSF